MDLKQHIIDGIIFKEGGYVNDSDDSGKEGKFGITKKRARASGYFGSMIDLPRQFAFDIYQKEYWDSVKGDDLLKISPDIAREVIDTGVNMGIGGAVKILQRALNVLNNRGKLFDDIAVDGALGPITLGVLSLYLDKRKYDGQTVLMRMLNSLQGAAYVELAERREKDEKFIFGWFLNRVVL